MNQNNPSPYQLINVTPQEQIDHTIQEIDGAVIGMLQVLKQIDKMIDRLSDLQKEVANEVTNEP